MKAKIDTKIFTMEGSPGVISIKNPDWNMTGEYTCAVQTFESTDKRSARLQIIGMCSVFYPQQIHLLYAYCFILFNLYTILQNGCIGCAITYGETLLNMIRISQRGALLLVLDYINKGIFIYLDIFYKENFLKISKL